MAFIGRGGFALSLATANTEFVSACVLDDANELAPDRQRGVALFVYASVSGSGKTRAMLELKKTLLKALALDDAMETDNDKTLNITAVAFGYTGFNSGLPLTDDETRYITNENTARTVLLRRIVGSVLVSQEEPTRLPKKLKLYEDFHFPSENHLMAMLVKYFTPPLKGTNDFVVLVVGIDEVQLLNKMKEVNGDDIGRIFLQTARQLQVELLTRANILLVPVGTGVLFRRTGQPAITQLYRMAMTRMSLLSARMILGLSQKPSTTAKRMVLKLNTAKTQKKLFGQGDCSVVAKSDFR